MIFVILNYLLNWKLIWRAVRICYCAACKSHHAASRSITPHHAASRTHAAHAAHATSRGSLNITHTHRNINNYDFAESTYTKPHISRSIASMLIPENTFMHNGVANKEI
jgi:hypothetical protein